MEDNDQRARHFLIEMTQALGIAPEHASHVRISGAGALPSIFAVTDFATAAIGAAGAAAREFLQSVSADAREVCVDRRLASLWFGFSIRPQGWSLPAPWDPIAGDYRGADGWIRLHTNAPHHRAAALAVLDVEADRPAVARKVAQWRIEPLEQAIIQNKGCAAAMRSLAAWAEHPQGQCVAREPLMATRATEDSGAGIGPRRAARPLQGVRVLDLTRVLAGPVATRFLAGLGADVLRIDPPGWEEPGVIPEVALGKRCARLDLRERSDGVRFRELLGAADVLVHGYRSDALEGLGWSAAARRAARPGLIDVSLDAYGWTGPWHARRGFDSLVQMSAGIAEAGMSALGKDRPTPLPVQALDQATGYLLAAAVLRGLTVRAQSGRGFEARASLARTAQLLIAGPRGDRSEQAIGSAVDADWSDAIEANSLGPLQRLRSPLTFGGTTLSWDRPAAALGSSPPSW